MKRLLLGVLLVAAGLAVACGDNGSSDENASPTAEPGTPTPTTTLSADQVITATQEEQVLALVKRPDGATETVLVALNSRVDDLCADDAEWSASQTDSVWRVVAECKKEETGTPAAFGFELLRFEWLYYSDLRQVMPVSQAAHDAQYPYPQPSPFPVGTPFAIPSPSGTP